MIISRGRKLASWALVGILSVAPFTQVMSSEYPDRPVRIVIPFTAGSGADTAARVFGEMLSKKFNASFVAENKPGGSGIVAVSALTSAPPDGHVIMIATNSPISVNPVMIKDLPYDPIKDLKPVSGVTRYVPAIAVAPNSKIRTLDDLLSAAKTSGKPLMVGTYSAGYQLALEWLSQQAGVKFEHVPYKGGAQVMSDIAGGHLDAGFVDLGGAAGMIKDGALRAIVTTGETRSRDFPDVPTVKESGFPDYEFYTWASFFVRASTPDDITQKLSDAMQEILATDEAREYAEKSSAELMPLDAKQMRAFQIKETKRFKQIAASAGLEAK